MPADLLPLPVALDPRFRALVSADARLRLLMTGTTWAEGPVWLPAAGGALIFSDVPNDRLMRWSPEGGGGVWETPSRFQNGHALDLDGRLVACEQGERRVSRRMADGRWETVVDRFEGRRLNSPNDIVVKSDGTIWFTDPPYGIVSDWEGHKADSEIGTNLVFRFDPADRTLEAVADSLEEPNGIGFSPDESILYVSDTSAALRTDGRGNHHIVAFDVVGGRRLARPRVFAVISPGLADGFAIDVAGNVFTSAGDGVQVYNADGTHLGTIRVPERVGNCTFGGADRATLFIAASTSLYAIDVATTGAGPRAT